MTTRYYWKALHKPSDQYLLNHIAGSTLHTNRIGSKWQYQHELEQILKRKLNKFVKGPYKIRFELEDWELQEFIVTLHKRVPMVNPKAKPLPQKRVERKIKMLKRAKDNGNRPKVAPAA